MNANRPNTEHTALRASLTKSIELYDQRYMSTGNANHDTTEMMIFSRFGTLLDIQRTQYVSCSFTINSLLEQFLLFFLSLLFRFAVFYEYAAI